MPALARVGRCMRRQRQRRPRGEQRAQLGGRQERLLRLENRPLDVAAQLLVALFDQLPRARRAFRRRRPRR